MRKRVLQIIPTLDEGGAEKQLTLLAERINREEFDLHVCALTRSGPYEAALKRAGVPFTLIGKRWKLDPFALRRLQKFIRDLQPDLVQTWLFAANSYGRTAAVRAGVKKIVASERCVDRWKKWFELMIDRRLARRTDRLVANSPGVVDFYVRQGLPSEKFAIIPNGVPLPDLPSEAERAAAREKLLASLSLPLSSKLIATVGRLWPQKRQSDLVWATDLLKCIRADAHLLVIGDGPLREKLKRFARQAQIETHVHFLGHRSDAAEILPHVDCLWLASSYEGQPNSVLEAMAAARPVVITDIPGNRDLVVHEECGFLVAVGDSAAFARCTKKILEDPDLSQRIGEAARARVKAEFSVEKMVARYETLYRELLSS